MKENNLYNLTQPSKNILNKDKKYQKNTAEYLDQYYSNLRESAERENEKILETAMSGARFSRSSAYTRSKNRVNALREEIEYTEKSSLLGMSAIVSQIVKESLLLDLDEYAKLNPNYEETIRETVYDLLSNGNINESIDNPDTLAIMEYVARKTPSAREGKTLTEDELTNYIESNKPKNIDASIKNLSGEVSSSVAQLMEKEQKKVDEIEKEVNKAKKNTKKKEEMPVEEVQVEDPNAMPVEGEMVPEEGAPVEEVVEEVPAEDPNAMPVEGQEMEQAAPGKTIHIDPNGATSISMPNGALALNPDGSMDIQLMEDAIDYCINEGIVDRGVNREYTETGLYKDINTELSTGVPTKYRGLFAYLLGGGLNVPNKKEKDEMLKLAIFIRKDPESKELLSRIKEKLAEYNTPKSNKGKIRQELHSLRNELVNSIRVTMAEYTFDNENEDRKADRNARANARNFKLETSKDVKTQLDLKESGLIRETMRCGLFESLAVNEASNMLARGEEYNPDLCLANAITYVTITETLNQMGLITVGDKEYAHIISAAGGNINESRATDRYLAKKSNPKAGLIVKQLTDRKHIDQYKEIRDKYNAHTEGKTAARIKAEAKVLKDKNDDRLQPIINKKEQQAEKHINAYKNPHVEQYPGNNETVPSAKRVPGPEEEQKIAAMKARQNAKQNVTESLDFAERIRQKKLNEEIVDEATEAQLKNYKSEASKGTNSPEKRASAIKGITAHHLGRTVSKLYSSGHNEEADVLRDEAKQLKKQSRELAEELCESAVTQWEVQQNTSNSDDLAERIRQRKLNR